MEVIKNLFKANAFTTGLAMFAMFFGSGNLIFPVGIGKMAGVQTTWAVAGLFVTAVFLPFFTLCLMLLYNGNYEKFFGQAGYWPGKIIAFVIMAMIGPFGVLPRCIAFSFATFSIYFDSVTLWQFSLVSCVLVFAFSIKPNDVVGLIGNILTPILLGSLFIIIYQGLKAEPNLLPNQSFTTNTAMLGEGFIEGYKTFDIFAALFFATAIMPAFRNVLGDKMDTCRKSLMSLAVKSSIIGGILLFVIYAGLSFVAANLQGALQDVPGEKLLGIISMQTMGQTAGLMANLVVSFACLTTAISLALVSAEFFKKEIFMDKMSYSNSLILTLIVTFIFSLMGFSGIMSIVLPILKVLCPAIIALVLASFCKKFFHFNYVMQTFYLVLVFSIFASLFL